MEGSTDIRNIRIKDSVANISDVKHWLGIFININNTNREFMMGIFGIYLSSMAEEFNLLISLNVKEF